ncbi:MULTISPECIES: hypothetical protein [Burkholderia]|uniref:hypothetical protein n=2 Tax=Burkholderiaceae TaxID=119060 RepID=UPI001E53A35B|nr:MULTISPECIES: hypothetical protein [unclassified Burkholderia]UEP29881.1 hypothetical protein LMA01_26055 [Burkholderia sp. B21-007]UEP44807.1 hypothetical protein LMA02_18725 [Burkholderia sp. B21-005]
MKIMPSHRYQSFRIGLSTAGLVLTLVPALVVIGTAPEASAQQTNQSSHGKIKAPPLPNGSANTIVKPGMSEEDWDKAYKETGRPKFNRSLVKRNGGNVERE